MASLLTPVRALARHSALRVLGSQRRLAEWHLAAARLAERQVVAGFELYRIGLQAGLRYTEVASDAVSGALAEASAPAHAQPGVPG